MELDALGEGDLLRILTEPENSLPRQYQAMLKTEGLDASFDADAMKAVSSIAFNVNNRAENIGARRLHTVMERLLEEISFKAPEMPKEPVLITADYVREKLEGILEDQDLERYIL